MPTSFKETLEGTLRGQPTKTIKCQWELSGPSSVGHLMTVNLELELDLLTLNDQKSGPIKIGISGTLLSISTSTSELKTSQGTQSFLDGEREHSPDN